MAPRASARRKKELERLGVLLRLHGDRLPNGYSSTEVKACEAAAAIEDGADELDMVVNLGDVKGRPVRPRAVRNQPRQKGCATGAS